ncbi:MAG: asparaginase domain-containing protein, partial [Rickettsiales bacterium]|nr:asparaginase domain-containing protein [Rickettsiales bacterium]
MNKKTLVIMTGGTIDAEAYPDPLNPPKNAIMLEKSLIPMTLAEMGVDKDCDFLSWRAKDSKHFYERDMIDLAQIIRTAEADTIIITHGTDAMPDNAHSIHRLLRQHDVQ